MSKFKAGDKVVRVSGQNWNGVQLGGEYIIGGVDKELGWWCFLQGIEQSEHAPYPFDCSNFELVEQPTEVSTLTPKEVLQAVVDGEELQVQHIVSKTWSDVTSDDVSINWARGRKLRIKPSTVEFNGTEVIQPKLDNAVKYSQKCYTFSEGLQTVIEARPSFVADSKLYWDTREDAWAALKAITAILRGE